ncbi:NAD(P)/FAD-dependent oxidoreductase [Mumia sp. Pv 4-285]|uniref:NAD(P)/FAD-dependent oxidoreductase n=1 Tax=Mumia qirimensis TaxID=3234852 RepID=UPI00351D6FB4
MSSTAEHVGTVVVAGGSVAGLLAAAAVAPYADRVMVLERDHPPARPGPRPGTPQAIHTHGLLPSGRQAMETLLPGFTEELVGAGALSDGDVGRVGRWWIGGGLVAECDLGLRGVAVSRPLLEHTLRTRVAAFPEVEVRSGVDVVRLLGDRGRVTGVVVRDRGGDPTEREIQADLVVDATGRSGRAMRWLPALGASAPREERVEVGIRYVTTHVEAFPDDLGTRVFVISAATPEVPRGAVAIRQEDDTWTLTLFAYGDEEPPLDTDALRRAAARITSSDVAGLLEDREPLHDSHAYRFPDSRRRRFERVDDLPTGYAAVGDAICSINPTFGQGMSLAALEAAALGDAVATGLRAVREDYPGKAASIVDHAWTVVTGADLKIPGVTGAAPPGHRVVSRYVDRLQRVARHDVAVAAALLKVTALVAPPESLMAPRVAVRVLRPGAAG